MIALIRTVVQSTLSTDVRILSSVASSMKIHVTYSKRDSLHNFLFSSTLTKKGENLVCTVCMFQYDFLRKVPFGLMID